MSLNIKSGLTEPECDRFRRDCNFTDEELAVFNLRVKNKSIIEIQKNLSEQNTPMSESTINRRLKSIKNKILKVM